MSVVFSTKRDEKQVYDSIEPRKRPTITSGTTQKIVTGDGVLYLTINSDDIGLSEVFTNIGKHGSEVAAWSEAVGRLISLCLRSGVSLKSLVEQLRGIISRPIWHNGEKILSVPDAIGNALSKYLSDNNTKPLSDTDVEENPGAQNENSVHYATCPDCGGPVEHESGCILCRICGFSRCG